MREVQYARPATLIKSVRKAMNEICAYHQLAEIKRERGILLDEGYEKCLHCSGYPLEEGCFSYTTRDHIENTYRLLNGLETKVKGGTNGNNRKKGQNNRKDLPELVDK